MRKWLIEYHKRGNPDVQETLIISEADFDSPKIWDKYLKTAEMAKKWFVSNYVQTVVDNVINISKW